MNVSGKKLFIKLKLTYCFATFIAFMGGVFIYAFFRNTSNMALFSFLPKPSFLNNTVLLRTESIWVCMFIYNLPYGLWCISGLLFVRAVWMNNEKWRKIYSVIFITLVMIYVLLKIPGIIPGTFDVLDLVFMGFFAFIESLIFKMFIRRYL